MLGLAMGSKVGDRRPQAPGKTADFLPTRLGEPRDRLLGRPIPIGRPQETKKSENRSLKRLLYLGTSDKSLEVPLLLHKVW